jgi:lysophospholipase L1-like esterase
MFNIVMIGSSIFEFWAQPNFENISVDNRAVRGTQSQYWLDTAQNGQLVKELGALSAIDNILLYCGSNDLIYGNCPTQIINNVCALLDQLSLLYPNSRIGYFSIMICPQKVVAGQQNIITDINKIIKHHCADKYDYFHFNDFIDNDAKWFIEDGLHLTEQAYLMLNDKLSPVLNKWVNNGLVPHTLDKNQHSSPK